jgi:hypothetical protein
MCLGIMDRWVIIHNTKQYPKKKKKKKKEFVCVRDYSV